jgi:hypothetical protein
MTVNPLNQSPQKPPTKAVERPLPCKSIPFNQHQPPQNPPTKAVASPRPRKLSVIPYSQFRTKEMQCLLTARLADISRTKLRVIQQGNVTEWSKLKQPENYSSVKGDTILLNKISEADKDRILDEFFEYFRQTFPNLTGIDDNGICQNKVVQIIARFVQENFLYTLGRNIDFSEMIEKRCGNCGDKAALFKLIVCLLKQKYPEKMEGITVDIIVQGAINPEYLGVGGELLKGVSSRGIKEETPDREIYINTFHFLTQVTVSSGQAILLDLSDSSHLSKEYGKAAQQGIPVYPGDIAITEQPDVNPFKNDAYLLFLPIAYMGIMRILPDTNYDKLLFRNGENPMFELRLVGIQSCLFLMYQEKSFEESKKLALDNMRNIRDLLNSDGTQDNLTQDPTTIKSFMPLIDQVSEEDQKALSQTFTETIEENEKPFTRPPSTIGKDAFFQAGVLNKATSKKIWDILQEQNVLNEHGNIITNEPINKITIGNLLPNENPAVIDRVLDVLYGASETALLEFYSRLSQAFMKRTSLQQIGHSVSTRTPPISKL